MPLNFNINNKKAKNKRYHFIAAGGVGQSALAKILVKMGYEVTGSDISNSKYLKELETLGAKVFIGHSEDNLPNDADVVLSTAIKEDNPELQRARRLGLNILHRSDVLLQICHEFALTIGFAGTHGKTTTSGLASYLLSKSGKYPAFAVGGIIPELNTNADYDKKSSLFVAELDESDGTISKYSPEILVINNLEADHPDFYKNGLEDVLSVFKNLTEKLPSDAKVIVNADDEGVRALLQRLNLNNESAHIIKFALNEKAADYTAQNVVFTADGAEFDLYLAQKPGACGKFLSKISTSLKGVHNVYNVLAVCAALIEAGYNIKDFSKYITGFTGMGRRFQTVYKSETVEIIDDYAHHPAEIRATLKAAREYKEKQAKKRTVAIFQPHRYSRLRALFDDFLNAFDDCDILIVLDAFSAGDNFDPEYNSEIFAKKYLEKYGDKVHYIAGRVENTVSQILSRINEGDIVLTLGAGDVTKLGKLIGEKL